MLRKIFGGPRLPETLQAFQKWVASVPDQENIGTPNDPADNPIVYWFVTKQMNNHENFYSSSGNAYQSQSICDCTFIKGIFVFSMEDPYSFESKRYSLSWAGEEWMGLLLSKLNRQSEVFTGLMVKTMTRELVAELTR